MDNLVALLNKALSDTFVMYFQAQAYHWNVEGIHFSQYHDFFGDIYEEVHGAVDVIAEKIRIEGAYAPHSLNELYKNASVVEDRSVPPTCQEMVTRLHASNAIVLASLNAAFTKASELNKQGLADLLAARIDAHKKHEWMLRVSMKGM